MHVILKVVDLLFLSRLKHLSEFPEKATLRDPSFRKAFIQDDTGGGHAFSG
jgi:hypothetical protein